MATPYIISLLTAVIIATYRVQEKSTFIIIFSGTISLLLFYIMGIVYECKKQLIKRLSLFFIFAIIIFFKLCYLNLVLENYYSLFY